jgi:glycosyltransferase involved in cell wall biosynthesis
MERTELRICIFSNHFYPENFKVNDIAFELNKLGYDVSVITAIPDYPQGRFYPGYSLFKRCKETINGVKIFHLPIIPRGKGGKVMLILNYLSFFVSSLIFTFFHSLYNRYDAVFVHLTSPFFVGLSAAFLKRRQKIPLVFWVLDLWPESMIAVGGIKNSVIIKSQVKLVQYIYDNCDKILIGSKGFEKSICQKGDYLNKLEYFPNWAEDTPNREELKEYSHIEPFSSQTNDDFIILFAGNLGEAQNLEVVIDVMSELRDTKNIKLVFLGDGRRKSYLMDKVVKLNLTDSVFFLGRFPLVAMPYFMQNSDVLLVSLKDELIFNLTVPSKVQFYMSQGKPILAMLNGEGSDLITNAQCGLAVPANNTQALKTAVQELCNKDKAELEQIGINGKDFYEEHFQKKYRIEQLDGIFQQIKKSRI